MVHRNACWFMLPLSLIASVEASGELEMLDVDPFCDKEAERESDSLHLMQLRVKAAHRSRTKPTSGSLFVSSDPDIGIATYVPTIHDNTEETCDGTDTEWGQKGEMEEAEDLETCQAHCSEHPRCKFIQYQPEIKQCHMYMDCQTTRSCENSCARTMRRLVASSYIPMEYDKTDLTCSGETTDWGTKGQMHDAETIEDCEAICNEDHKCHYIQFQAEKGKCHLYEGCAITRECESACGRTMARLMPGTYIPTQYDRTDLTCDGTDSDWGLKGKITEGVEHLQGCRDLCGKEPDCRFIQYQPEQGTCHLYKDCAATRACDGVCARTMQRLVAGTLIPTRFDNTDQTCDGSDTEWGEKGLIEDADSIEACRELCAQEPRCHFLQFQSALEKCHLYEDCHNQRHCEGVCERTFRRLALPDADE